MASPSATTATRTTTPPKSPSIRVETIAVSTDTKSTETITVIPTVLGASSEGRSPTKLTVTPPAPIPSPPPTSSTTKATVPNTPTIIASSVPSSLKSPAFPSELPRSPMSATFSLLPHTPGVEGSLKTPITPPVAYMDFLKNAIASPSDLKSPKFLPHHHSTGTGHASAGPSSPMFPHAQGSKRYRASLSGPSGGMPSPGLLGAHMQALAKANANSAGQGTKREHVYTPTHSSALSSARSSTSSLSSITSSSGTGTDSESVSRSSSGTSLEREPVVAESSKKVVRFAESENSGKGKNAEGQEEEEEVEGEIEDEDDVMEEVDCTRRQCINKDGTVTIKQVVTTTVTFKPRMSLMPAPKGKRRRIE